MFRFLRHWNNRRILRRYPVDESVWQETLAAVPILAGLSSQERAQLRDLTTLFLHQKVFLPAGGLQLNPAMRMLIAAQACYPILNLGLGWYRGWNTVIVYPGRFLRLRREIDHAGVMHEWTDVLRGESWERGPIVLSWADVSGSGRGDGYNVIIHELAHKLDMLNGAADGFPPLHRNMRVPDWTRAFSAAFTVLNTALSRGERSPIDPYAAESPAECFAVLSEYFFELPNLIRHLHPAVYECMATFYRQDPCLRLSPPMIEINQQAL